MKTENKQKNSDVLKPNLKAAMASGLITWSLIGLVGGAAAAYVFGPIGILATLVIIVLGNIASYLNIKSREYRFKQNQLEWYEGFLNINQRNVSYNRVTDISLHQPITQRIFGTGTILINTAGSDAREVSISFINNPEKEYERIKQITEN